MLFEILFKIATAHCDLRLEEMNFIGCSTWTNIYRVEFLDDQAELTKHVIEIRIDVYHSIGQTCDGSFHFTQIFACVIDISFSRGFDFFQYRNRIGDLTIHKVF